MSVDAAISALVEALKNEDEGDPSKVVLSDFGPSEAYVYIAPRATIDAVISVLKRTKRY